MQIFTIFKEQTEGKINPVIYFYTNFRFLFHPLFHQGRNNNFTAQEIPPPPQIVSIIK